MAMCGRCGRQVAAADLCPSCRADGPANVLVAAHPGLALRASGSGSSPRPYSTAQLYAQAHRYWPTEPDHSSPADPGWRLLHGQAGAAASAPPRFERANAESSVPSAAPTAEPRSGRWIAMLAATAVLISTAAVAVVLVGRYHPVAAHTPRADVPSLVATSATSAPIVPPAGQNQLAVGTAAATSPHAAAVVAPLSRYFDAVSHHSYGLYRRQFILALRGGLSAASFNAEFGATGPAAEQLQSITVIGGGTVEATVTVISRQLTAGPVSSACTAWIIEFYLGWRGYRYLLTAPPLWRQAAYHNCI